VQVVHLEVPPLRDRGNDVLLLAQHFLESFAARAGKPVGGFSAAAAQCLMRYPWPGNVRELQNCMERAVALTEHAELIPEDLPERVREDRSLPPLSGGRRLLTLDEVERAHIRRILEASGGNKTQAARVLGVDRKTLYRKLEDCGLPAAELPREPDRVAPERRPPWHFSTPGQNGTR
jgi:DNA-binding NtrC family response regulator